MVTKKTTTPKAEKTPRKPRARTPIKTAIAYLGRRAVLSAVAPMLAKLAGDERDEPLRAELVRFVATVQSVAGELADDTPTDTTPDQTDEGIEAVDEAFHSIGARACVRAVVASMPSGPHASTLLRAIEAFDQEMEAALDREEDAWMSNQGDGDEDEPDEDESDDEEAA